MGFFTCCLLCAFICCCGCCFAGARYRDQWQGNQPAQDGYRQPDAYEMQERRDSHGNVISGQGPPNYLNGIDDDDHCHDHHHGQRQEPYAYGQPTPMNPPGYAPIIHGGYPHTSPAYPPENPNQYPPGGQPLFGAPQPQFQFGQQPNLYGGAPEQLPPDFFMPNPQPSNATAATAAGGLPDRGVNYPSKVESKWTSALDAAKKAKEQKTDGTLAVSEVVDATPKIKL